MVFYKCPKCSKKWQHPVGMCPFCLVSLEKICSSKMKIVAMSQVFIPSLLHPKVPFYVLMVEDEYGNRFFYKTMEEKKVGTDIIFERDENTEAVAIFKVGYDLIEGIQNSLNLLGVELDPKCKVLVLPTLNHAVHNYFRENTSVEFLDALLQYLTSLGLKNVKIATQSFDGFPIGTIAHKAGLLDICSKHQIIPSDLEQSEFVDFEDIRISKEVFDADIVLNVSSLKYGKSASAENIFRVIHRDDYSSLKYLHDESFLIEKVKKIKNVITIGEATYPQRTDKFPIYRGLVLASKNFVNLDTVFNATGLVKRMPDFLRGINLDNIPIVGRRILEVQRDSNIVL